MKSSFLLLLIVFNSMVGFAQIPEDALKFSWNRPTGTARVQAVGGAMGALGGDITATFTNPAGLAFFKTNDFVITPGITMNKNTGNFRGDIASDNKLAFNLGTSGAVFGFGTRGSKWNSAAFSIAVSQTANFSSNILYNGKNNYSSYGEQFASEVANSGLSLDQALNSNNVSLQSRLAVYTFLVDTLTLPGNSNPDVVSLAQWNSLKNGSAFLVNQQKSVRSSGGITEIALGFAGSRLDKLYIGGSLGVPIVNYQKTSIYRETDASGDNNNNFNYSELKENFSTKGVGLNLKLGVIYKVAEQLRMGLAIHSPTFFALTDSYDATMTTDVEGYTPYADKPTYQPHTTTAHLSDILTSNEPTSFKYDLSNPWRVMVSGAYVINAVEDVKQQRGFITGDIEYVNYKSHQYTNADPNADNSYYSGVNTAIKSYYKSAFNFRLGGELKLNTFMARLGFAYYGDPYKDSELKANKMFISGGLGYRNKGMFFDISYVVAVNKDVNFPYRLSDKANTFALLKETGGSIAVTAGFKF